MGASFPQEWFGVAMVANRKKVLLLACVAALALAIWAWIDGGKRRIQPMVEEVPVPENVK